MTREVGFGEDDLRGMAGTRSLDRRLGYLDAVTGLEVGDGQITATVHGSDAYMVELSEEEGLFGACDCPYGRATSASTASRWA
ncbi:hypothetical protein [Streptomyces sp. A3M-1-3]|uniref:SWIM zinc finger family protein n=1 Tax=Streptomyces sp. A3M-1-3 TaxID=2962044 RepID=UPI0027E50316|nr:hypothetical protein [Streptomyces sp. A3M-1-3]